MKNSYTNGSRKEHLPKLKEERKEIKVRFRVNGKTYRVREGSILYHIGCGLVVAAMVAGIGLMHSWELGLL